MPKEVLRFEDMLRRQIERIEELGKLSFDDTAYNEWRIETGRILDQLFPSFGSDKHPCVLAFLNYRIPDQFTASSEDMQNYYHNILQYQKDLLVAYLEDINASIHVDSGEVRSTKL